MTTGETQDNNTEHAKQSTKHVFCTLLNLMLKCQSMMLSDHITTEKIAKGKIVIEPLHLHFIQPASIDVNLNNKLPTFETWRHPLHIAVKHHDDFIKEH